MARMARRYLRWALVGVLCLAIWIAADLSRPVHHDIRRFDGAEVGRLEEGMWRSYYEHHAVRLLGQMHELLGKQFGLPYWRAWQGAFYATRAAVVFQRGHNRSEYERALGDLEHYYALIRRSSIEGFDTRRVAALELEWWIVHRERASHPAGDLERALADLQAAIYQQPAGDFTEHAKARAEAMVIRDSSAESGGTREGDWQRIDGLLRGSWSSLERVVAR